MAFSPSDLTAIDAAIASGELTVEFDDRRLTYRSVDELIKARRVIQAQLDAANPTPGARPRTALGYILKE